MHPYHKTKLQNSFLAKTVKQLYRMNFISKTQQDAFFEENTFLKSSDNILIRVCFFLLGCFLFLSAIAGCFPLYMIVENYPRLIPYLIAFFGFIGLELLARSDYFGHGLDDAFIICSQIALCCGVYLSFESMALFHLLLFLSGLICCLRYIHGISVVICCVGLVGFLFEIVVRYAVIDELFLPLLGFFLALALYAIYLKFKSKSSCFLYQNPLLFLKIFALLLGYFSLNYMVVRELSQSLMNIVVTPKNDIPLAYLFYSLTFLIPVIYMVYALFSKDRIMLFTAVFCLAYSVFTIRYYYQLMPIENGLILGGMLLFTIAYFAIKKLQNKTTGITFMPDRDSNGNFLNAQVFVLSQMVFKTPINDSKITFGGGGFSGGGAGSSF